jgi:hypothetical protein
VGLAAKRRYITAQGFSPGLREREIRPESTSNPAAAGCNSEKAQYSSTPTLRPQGIEDEDEDEDDDEDEAPHEWRLRVRLSVVRVLFPLVCPTSGATFRAPSTNRLTQGWNLSCFVLPLRG